MPTYRHHEAAEARASDAGEEAARFQSDSDEPHNVVGEVVEVLPTFGVAHVRASGGLLLGLNRQTLGVSFESLEVGQRLRLAIEGPHLRVARFELLS